MCLFIAMAVIFSKTFKMEGVFEVGFPAPTSNGIVVRGL